MALKQGVFAKQSFQGVKPVTQSTGEGMLGRLQAEMVILPVYRVDVYCICTTFL